MKKLITLTLALVLALECIGLWHASPAVGSGFSERLALNDDNTFLWAASQMDGMERARFRSGTWAVKNGTLKADYAALKTQAAPKPGSPQIITVGPTMTESDKYVLEKATTVLGLLKNKDWGALGHLVHPVQGLTFSPYGYVDTSSAVRLGAGDVIPLWMDDTVRTWGFYDGSGNPIKGTINDYYKRFIMSHDFTKAPVIGIDRIIRSTLENNLYVFGNGGAYVDFHIPGSESNPDHTWASLRLVFAGYTDNELYLVAIVHDEWTI